MGRVGKAEVVSYNLRTGVTTDVVSLRLVRIKGTSFERVGNAIPTVTPRCKRVILCIKGRDVVAEVREDITSGGTPVRRGAADPSRRFEASSKICGLHQISIHERYRRTHPNSAAIEGHDACVGSTLTFG